MRFIKPALFFIFSISFFFNCSSRKRESNKSQISTISDSISYYFIKAKKQKKDSTYKWLPLLNKAQKLSLKHNADSSLINIYSLKNAFFSKTKLEDSILIYARKMLNIASKENDSAKIGKAYFKLAIYYDTRSKYDSAYYYFNASKDVFLKLKDSSQVGRKLNAMGRILIDDNDYYFGEATLVEALQYLNSGTDDKFIASVNHNLSIASRFQSNYIDALQYIDTAIKLTNIKKDKLKYINSKALIFKENKNFTKAIKVYDDLLKDSLLLKNKKEYARALDNLAYTKWLENENLNLESELNRVLLIRDSLHDQPGLIASHSHLMEYYSKRDTTKAIHYAKLLYNLTLEQNNIEDRLQSLNYLRKLVPLQNSVKYIDEYIQVYDSITKARNISKHKYAMIRYDSSRKEKELLKSKEEISKKNLKIANETSKRNLLIFITSLLVIGVVFIVYDRKKRIKIAGQNAIIKTENRISKKVHDEMANDISNIKTLVKNHIPQTNPVKKQILNMLDTSYISARDIATETGGIIFGDSFGDTLKNLLMQHNDDAVKIVTSISAIDNIVIDEYKKNAIYRALQELMVNMNKHSQATKVTIAYKNESKHHEIRYTDNGVGSDTVQKNRGLQNAVTRMEDIGGSFNFKTSKGNGFIASLKFKA